MSGLTRFTTFVDGNSLPAADLEGELDEIYDAFNGTNNREISIGSTSGPVLIVNGKGVAPVSFRINGTETCAVNASGQLEFTPEAWTAPALINSWTDYLSGAHAVGYRKMPGGRVVLRGAVAGGSVGTVAFVLPTGYRPASTVNVPAVSDAGFARIDIDSSGNVAVITGSTTFTSFEGISFSVN